MPRIPDRNGTITPMILVRDIRLPLSAGEEQAKAQALKILRLPAGRVGRNSW